MHRGCFKSLDILYALTWEALSPRWVLKTSSFCLSVRDKGYHISTVRVVNCTLHDILGPFLHFP
jgi:hypothetical protein